MLTLQGAGAAIAGGHILAAGPDGGRGGEVGVGAVGARQHGGDVAGVAREQGIA